MQINEQAVRERAYYIWEGEGRVHGCADIHWLRAEAELTMAEPAKTPARKAAGKPAVKAETVKAATTPVAAKPAAKAAAKSVAKAKSIDAAVPPLPGSKAAKPKVEAGAAVAATAAKGKPARGRASLH